MCCCDVMSRLGLVVKAGKQKDLGSFPLRPLSLIISCGLLFCDFVPHNESETLKGSHRCHLNAGIILVVTG